jgi:hypothetical protein
VFQGRLSNPHARPQLPNGYDHTCGRELMLPKDAKKRNRAGISPAVG